MSWSCWPSFCQSLDGSMGVLQAPLRKPFPRFLTPSNSRKWELFKMADPLLVGSSKEKHQNLKDPGFLATFSGFCTPPDFFWSPALGGFLFFFSPREAQLGPLQDSLGRLKAELKSSTEARRGSEAGRAEWRQLRSQRILGRNQPFLGGSIGFYSKGTLSPDFFCFLSLSLSLSFSFSFQSPF